MQRQNAVTRHFVKTDDQNLLNPKLSCYRELQTESVKPFDNVIIGQSISNLAR